jgi:uncharacterized protein YcaQ
LDRATLLARSDHGQGTMRARYALAVTTLHIAAPVARRFLVLRHLLAPPRGLPADPSSVLTVVERLGSLQFDPLEVAGRNHDLVLQARVASYRRAWTDALLYEDRVLFEAYNKSLSILPVAEMPWYRLTWDRARRRHEGGAFDEHAPLVEELLERIRADGPLSPTDVGPRAAIDWYWRPTNQVRAILEALAEAGIIGIARREGNRRVYDLIERLYPTDLLVERRTEREAVRHKLLSRYRAHGLLGAGGRAEIWLGIGRAVTPDPSEPDRPTRKDLHAELLERALLVPATVEGVRGERYVLTAELPVLAQAERELAEGVPPGGEPPGVTFLAPLDPLAWDRDLLRSLFDFDYLWEVYVPEAKRRWGYYVLPLLFGDRFVGRIEPRIERRERTVRIHGLLWEDGFDALGEPGFVRAFADALAAYRAFAGADRVALPADRASRALARAVTDLDRDVLGSPRRRRAPHEAAPRGGRRAS